MALLRLMPASDMNHEVFEISSLPSDSETRMPASPLWVTSLPPIRLSSEPSSISMPPSLFCDTVLSSSVFSVARSSSMPRSPPPLTLLRSSRLWCESRTRRPGPPLPVATQSATSVPSVPLTSATPSALPWKRLVRISLPSICCSSSSSPRPPVNSSMPAT